MEPNDTQPGGPPIRTVTIQLTRDTLILMAALAFLAIAIVLAVIFPGRSSAPTTATATGVASRQTAQPTLAGGTAVSIPIVSGGAATAEVAGVATEAPTPPQEGYPAPSATLAPTLAEPTSAGAPQQQAIPTASAAVVTTSPIPPFDPLRPTQPGGGAASEFTAQATAYPAPITGTATQPADNLDATSAPVTPATNSSATRTQATPAPAPTSTPRPPSAPAATSQPVIAPTRRPQPTAKPTPPPVDVLRGNVRWTAAQSPIFVRRDLQLVAGATLTVEPGVEVHFAPGAAFFVEGTLYAIGGADRPVRFVGAGSQRWEGIFGRPGSNIAFENAEIRGGGNGGTVLLSEGGNLVLHHTRVADNGGHIQVSDSRLEVRDSEIAGNDMPYGSAIEASYTSGNGVILTNNRIGGNRLQPGASPLLISSQSSLDTLNLDLEGNLLVGTEGPDLALFTNGPLQGGMSCNTLVGGPDGLSLRSDLPQVPGFSLNVRDNVIDKHTPPIIPIYLKYGIGRGATSEIGLDMRNNWWGSSLGPYEPDRNADGRGQAVGDTITFAPWLTSRPACAPQQ